MKVRKILLAIDGSVYSQQAADVAWSIAILTGASVTAMHVIDTESVIDLIGHVDAGFLDVADYKEERGAIVRAITSASNKLVQKYAQAARQHGIEAHAVVESGNPCDVLCAAARDVDLLVMGHKPFVANEKDRFHRQLMRLSVAEYLSETVDVPLLVVQAARAEWKSMTVMSSLDHVNRAYIDSCVEFGYQLDIQPLLVCLSTTNVEEPPTELIDDLRASDSGLKDVPIAVTGIEELRDKQYEVWNNPTLSEAWDEWGATLLTIPTRGIPGGRRLTIADGSASRFIRYATLPAVLFYPEENVPAGSPQVKSYLFTTS